MNLIDKETGIEYKAVISRRFADQFDGYLLKPTGLKYEMAARYGSKIENEWVLGTTKKISDTHIGICFLEPLKKIKPRPEVLVGDYLEWGHPLGGRSSFYVTSGIEIKGESNCDRHYRNGKLIWERD